MIITRPTLTDNDTLTAAQANLLFVVALALAAREVTPDKLFSVTNGKLLGRFSTGDGDVEQTDVTALGLALLAAANNTVARALLNCGTIATQNAGDVDITGGKITADSYRSNPDVITYAGTVALNFDRGQKTMQSIVLGGALTLTTTNLANGAAKMLRIANPTGSALNLNLPGGWKALDVAKPTALAAGKTGQLTLLAYGATDADVLMRWSAEV